MIKMKVEGLQELVTGLAQSRNLIDAIAAALYQEAEAVMTASKELCPVDTGALRASGHVELPKIEGSTKVSVKLGYGGPSVDYAEKIHEDLSLSHPVGQAKFLEQPLMEAEPKIKAELTARIRENLLRLSRRGT